MGQQGICFQGFTQKFGIKSRRGPFRSAKLLVSSFARSIFAALMLLVNQVVLFTTQVYFQNLSLKCEVPITHF